ncbi:hypothetical protein [Gemella cuniculi]|uniref:hypothetical protein n=1 Tax=Gemella cuniculi TaxID=150240 RepID=UPI0004152D95|nr:hypothetical protein [Gemella cuniculi]
MKKLKDYRNAKGLTRKELAKLTRRFTDSGQNKETKELLQNTLGAFIILTPITILITYAVALLMDILHG